MFRSRTGPLIRRQSAATRLTHWLWAAAMVFLVGSGLQIFNAHPILYLGDESGFDYDNAVLRIGAVEAGGALRGYVRSGDAVLFTTGVLGVSEGEARAFPAWATIPGKTSLATGRVVHFFFAWVLVATLAVWLAASLINGHWRELVPTWSDLRALPRDVADHARLRLHHGRRYGPLQKLAYAAVLFGLFPLIVATGLSMSPGMNAAMPWLPELFGGRQTARTLHFAAMLGFVAFFLIHIAMVLLAGPLNLLRAMVTGWTRIDPEEPPPQETSHAR